MMRFIMSQFINNIIFYFYFHKFEKCCDTMYFCAIAVQSNRAADEKFPLPIMTDLKLTN